MVSDPIANFINAIKVANKAGRQNIKMPHSKIKEAIARVLKESKFISSYKIVGDKKKAIEISLLYTENGDSRIRGTQMVSRQSKRVYQKSDEIRSVKGGYGILVLTTPRGVMSDKEARKQKVGGEALFKIW